MEVKEVPIKDIKPNEKNPRKHSNKQIYDLIENIKKYGFIVPVLVNKDYKIIAGHARYIASKQMKLEKIPCVILEKNLTEQEEYELMIEDNRLSEMSTWDKDNIVFNFDELNETLQKYFSGIIKNVEIFKQDGEVKLKQWNRQWKYIIIYTTDEFEWVNMKIKFDIKNVYDITLRNGTKTQEEIMIEYKDFLGRINGN